MTLKDYGDNDLLELMYWDKVKQKICFCTWGKINQIPTNTFLFDISEDSANHPWGSLENNRGFNYPHWFDTSDELYQLVPKELKAAAMLLKA